MTNIFTAFLLTSLIGTLLSFLIILSKPITRKVFSAAWHYYAWLCVIVVMMLPIRINIPKAEVENSVLQTEINVTEEISEIEIMPLYEIKQNEEIQTVKPVFSLRSFLKENIETISYIWLIGAVIMFLIKIIGYIIFNIRIHKNSKIHSCPQISEYTSRKIKVRLSSTICSPLMLGIIRPTLILPEVELNDEQFSNILHHEMTHLKRNDIIYKWLVSFVKCIHWFNPMIYYIGKQVNSDCEISCDMAVVSNMTKEEEKSYIETILSLLTNNNKKAIPLTTGMAGDKNTLKKRFLMIKNKIMVSKKAKVISVFLALLICAVSIFISGVIATDIFKTEIAENIKTNENNYSIEVRDNNELIQFENEPFYRDETLYLPLREFFEKTGLANKEDIVIKSDKITLNLSEYDNNIKLNYNYSFEIGKTGYIINPEGGPVSLSENTLYKKYTNIKQKTKSYPIIHNDLVYIPYEYVEYMVNKVMQTHNISVFDITGLKNSTNNTDNAENMSFEDIRSLQLSVDNGHFPWRLDPAQVIISFLSQKGESVSKIRLPEIENDKLDYEDDNFKITLFKPIDKTQNGIWIVKSYKKKNNIELSTLIWPVESKTISQNFGKRVHPITGEEKSHNGVDIIADENSIVVSSISGKVTDAGYDNEFGKFIVIENSIGIKVKYAHLSEISVKKGNTVSRKDIIGKVGKTGMATGAQLHFEVQLNGEYVDPIQFLNAEKEKDVNVIKEVFFYERTPEQTMIEKQEDGWYKVPQYISVFFQYEGKTPHSMLAYFTPTGTNAESKKRLIGKTDTFIYQTKANVLSMDINFSEEDTLGHLWFEFEYENGEKISTEYFKVYRKALGDPPYKPTSVTLKKDIKLKTDKSAESSDIVLSHLTLNEKISSDEISALLKYLGLSYSDNEVTNLKTSYTTGEIKSGTYSFLENKNIRCDKNGNITIFFDDESTDYIDITFTDCDTGKQVAGYGVMPENTKTFSFMGFKNDKTYNVSLISLHQNPEKKIKYVIY